MAVYNIYDAKAHFSKLVDQAAHGEEVVIAKAGKPMVKMVPIMKEEAKGKRKFGQNVLGITYIAPDFDEPMSEEELKEWGY
jgi:prevent-host-death family protein